MPWTVSIEDEDGCAQSEMRPVIDFSLIFSIPDLNLLPHTTTSQLLKYLDPWGDTVFNRLQLNDLRHEWAVLIPTEDERPPWKDVAEMIEHCIRTPHFYMRFLGD